MQQRKQNKKKKKQHDYAYIDLLLHSPVPSFGSVQNPRLYLSVFRAAFLSLPVAVSFYQLSAGV